MCAASWKQIALTWMRALWNLILEALGSIILRLLLGLFSEGVLLKSV